MADSVKIKITGEDAEFQKTLSGIGKTASSVFKGVMSSQIVTKGVSAIISGLKTAINTGKEFEASMSNVYALSGANAAEQAMLMQTAKDYGASTKFTASQAADALSYMALAGWNAQQSVDALGGVLNLAAASGMDLGRASDVVTDYLSAFGMECDKAGYMADLMAYAQSKSNTTADALAEAYGNCASTMHAAGQDIETTTAMLMALANQGIKGSEAGTQMAAVMRDLTQKMKNGQIMIGKTAITVADAQGNFSDLNDIMADVGKATAGMGTAEASAALMDTFTARSVKAVQTILNEGLENVNSYEDALRHSEGTAEEQSKIMLDNLQGDITIFQSALEGLEITASESFNGIARGIVQQGTDILNVLNKAGETGGIEGMADALIAQIPAMLPKVTQGVQKLLQGLGKRLPGLVKGLIAQLPGILSSAGTLVPSLVDSLFEAAGGAVEGLIGRLPDLVPILLKGLGNTLLSVGSGVMSLVQSVFDGVGGALMDIGLIAPDVNNAIGKIIDGIDQENVARIRTGIETEPPEFDKEAYKQQLQTAISDISGAIDEITGVSEVDKAKIKKDIMDGSGAQAVIDALMSINVPEGTATAAAESLKAAVSEISGAIDGLGLTEAQAGEVKQLVISGASPAEIQACIQSYGVGKAEAASASTILTGAFTTLDTTLQNLKLDKSTITTLETNCTSAQGEITAALTLLGAPQGTVDAVLASYDTVASTIAGKISGVMIDVYQKLTDGVSGNDTEAVEAAKTAIADEYDKAIGEIEAIRTEKLTQLEESGLTGTALEQAAQEVNEQVDGIVTNLEGLKTQADAWLADNANASTETVKANYAQLQEICDLAAEASAQIDEAKAKLNTTDTAMMEAVKTGAISNRTTQAEAIGTAGKIRDNGIAAAAETRKAQEEAAKKDLQAAQEAYDRAYAEGIDTTAAQAAIDAATTSLNDAQTEFEATCQSVNESYDQTMRELLQGMMKANDPEAYQKAFDLSQQLDVTDQVESLYNSVSSAINQEAITGEAISLQDFLGGLEFSDSDWTAIADQAGMSVEELQKNISDTLKSQNLDSLMFNPSDIRTNLETQLAETLQGSNFTGAAEAYLAAVQEGFTSSTDAVDWSNIDAALSESISTIGSNVVSGYANALGDTGSVDTAGQTLGEAGTDGVASGAGVASPSWKTHQTGVYVAQGYAEGITSGTGAVATAAAALGSAAVTYAKTGESAASTIGSNFAAGLAAGIRSGQSGVIAAAIAIAQAAIRAAKSALQERSPSKAMKQVGLFAGEGFSIGLENSLHDAVKAAQSVVGVLNLKPSMDFSGITGKFGTALQDFSAVESQREIALYLGREKVASTMAPYTNRALNGYQDSIGIGVGRG